ncbi:hypothetical protein PENSPDRAFT_595318, partial [Peniophora sp. CONT]
MARSSKNKGKKGITYDFPKDHPQYKTHRIRISPEDKSKIPNFVGGNLPRRDKGDSEEYCRAMLTLFKPWCNPMTLKYEKQTWQQAFERHEFTERQRTVMDFFHVRYECNDARDDFRAQRVSGAK